MAYAYINPAESAHNESEKISINQDYSKIQVNPATDPSNSYAATFSAVLRRYGSDYSEATFSKNTPYNCQPRTERRLTFSQATYSITATLTNGRGVWYVDYSGGIASQNAANSLDKSIAPPLLNRKIRDSYCQYPGGSETDYAGESSRTRRTIGGSTTIKLGTLEYSKPLGTSDNEIDEDYPVIRSFLTTNKQNPGTLPSSAYLASKKFYSSINWTRNNDSKTTGGITPIRDTDHLVSAFKAGISVIAATIIDKQQLVLPVTSITYTAPKTKLDGINAIHIKEIELLDTADSSRKSIKLTGDEFLKNSDFIFSIKL